MLKWLRLHRGNTRLHALQSKSEELTVELFHTPYNVLISRTRAYKQNKRTSSHRRSSSYHINPATLRLHVHVCVWETLTRNKLVRSRDRRIKMKEAHTGLRCSGRAPNGHGSTSGRLAAWHGNAKEQRKVHCTSEPSSLLTFELIEAACACGCVCLHALQTQNVLFLNSVPAQTHLAPSSHYF